MRVAKRAFEVLMQGLAGQDGQIPVEIEFPAAYFIGKEVISLDHLAYSSKSCTIMIVVRG